VKTNGYEVWLNRLKTFLQQTLGWRFRFDKKTPHAVQFVYDGKIEVDLLLSPYWSNPRLLYDFLGTVPKDKHFRLVKEHGLCLHPATSMNTIYMHQLQVFSECCQVASTILSITA